MSSCDRELMAGESNLSDTRDTCDPTREKMHEDPAPLDLVENGENNRPMCSSTDSGRSSISSSQNGSHCDDTNEKTSSPTHIEIEASKASDSTMDSGKTSASESADQEHQTASEQNGEMALASGINDLDLYTDVTLIPRIVEPVRIMPRLGKHSNKRVTRNKLGKGTKTKRAGADACNDEDAQSKSPINELIFRTDSVKVKPTDSSPVICDASQESDMTDSLPSQLPQENGIEDCQNDETESKYELCNSQLLVLTDVQPSVQSDSANEITLSNPLHSSSHTPSTSEDLLSESETPDSPVMTTILDPPISPYSDAENVDDSPYEHRTTGTFRLQTCSSQECLTNPEVDGTILPPTDLSSSSAISLVAVRHGDTSPESVKCDSASVAGVCHSDLKTISSYSTSSSPIRSHGRNSSKHKTRPNGSTCATTLNTNGTKYLLPNRTNKGHTIRPLLVQSDYPITQSGMRKPSHSMDRTRKSYSTNPALLPNPLLNNTNCMCLQPIDPGSRLYINHQPICWWLPGMDQPYASGDPGSAVSSALSVQSNRAPFMADLRQTNLMAQPLFQSSDGGPYLMSSTGMMSFPPGTPATLGNMASHCAQQLSHVPVSQETMAYNPQSTGILQTSHDGCPAESDGVPNQRDDGTVNPNGESNHIEHNEITHNQATLQAQSIQGVQLTPTPSQWNGEAQLVHSSSLDNRIDPCMVPATNYIYVYQNEGQLYAVPSTAFFYPQQNQSSLTSANGTTNDSVINGNALNTETVSTVDSAYNSLSSALVPLSTTMVDQSNCGKLTDLQGHHQEVTFNSALSTPNNPIYLHQIAGDSAINMDRSVTYDAVQSNGSTFAYTTPGGYPLNDSATCWTGLAIPTMDSTAGQGGAGTGQAHTSLFVNPNPMVLANTYLAHGQTPGPTAQHVMLLNQQQLNQHHPSFQHHHQKLHHTSSVQQQQQQQHQLMESKSCMMNITNNNNQFGSPLMQDGAHSMRADSLPPMGKTHGTIKATKLGPKSCHLEQSGLLGNAKHTFLINSMGNASLLGAKKQNDAGGDETLTRSGSGGPANRQKKHSSKTNLYIRGLPTTFTEEQLHTLAPEEELIRSVKLIAGTEGEMYGFIDFTSNTAARAALLHIKSMNRQLYVNFAYESEKDPHNVYITNIPETWTASNVEDLKKTFQPYGQIATAIVMTKRSNNFCTGAGFVRFVRAEDAQRAIEGIRSTQVTLDGGKGPLEVKLADRQKATDEHTSPKQRPTRQSSDNTTSGASDHKSDQTHENPTRYAMSRKHTSCLLPTSEGNHQLSISPACSSVSNSTAGLQSISSTPCATIASNALKSASAALGCSLLSNPANLGAFTVPGRFSNSQQMITMALQAALNSVPGFLNQGLLVPNTALNSLHVPMQADSASLNQPGLLAYPTPNGITSWNGLLSHPVRTGRTNSAMATASLLHNAAAAQHQSAANGNNFMYSGTSAGLIPFMRHAGGPDDLLQSPGSNFHLSGPGVAHTAQTLPLTYSTAAINPVNNTVNNGPSINANGTLNHWVSPSLIPGMFTSM